MKKYTQLSCSPSNVATKMERKVLAIKVNVCKVKVANSLLTKLGIMILMSILSL